MIDVDACAQRLHDMIDLLKQTRPFVVLDLERRAQEIIGDDVQLQVVERMHRLPAEDNQILEAISEHLDQRLQRARRADREPDD